MHLHPATRWTKGLTLVESVLALAIIFIVMAAVLPQVRIIHNSLDSKRAATETLQNGRVLIEHLRRKLATARRITAVSIDSETTGYIEFEDNDPNDANDYRYDINSTTDYVTFGPVANPVDKGDGRAAVFTVNTGDWSIGKNTSLDFEPTSLIGDATPALCQIDAAHYLCAYSGLQGHGFSGVLELNFADLALRVLPRTI